MTCKFIVYVNDEPRAEFDTREEAEDFARGYEDWVSEDFFHGRIETKEKIVPDEKKPYQTPELAGPFANAREMFVAKFEKWIDHAKKENSVHVSIPVVAAESLLQQLAAPRTAWVVERVIPTSAPERLYLANVNRLWAWAHDPARALHFAREIDAKELAELFDYTVIREVELQGGVGTMHEHRAQ